MCTAQVLEKYKWNNWLLGDQGRGAWVTQLGYGHLWDEKDWLNLVVSHLCWSTAKEIIKSFSSIPQNLIWKQVHRFDYWTQSGGTEVVLTLNDKKSLFSYVEDRTKWMPAAGSHVYCCSNLDSSSDWGQCHFIQAPVCHPPTHNSLWVCYFVILRWPLESPLFIWGRPL